MIKVSELFLINHIAQLKSTNDHKVVFAGNRHDNVYVFHLNNLYASDVKCLYVNNENSWLWHRRLGNAHMDLIAKLLRNDLVIGLPKIKFEKDHFCSACQ